MQKNTKEPPDTTTQARRSLPSWRSVVTQRIRAFLISLAAFSSVNVVFFLPGDGDDKRAAGVNGTHGECVQSRHPSHHLLGSAGLLSNHSARPAAAGNQEEEECHPEVRIT